MIAVSDSIIKVMWADFKDLHFLTESLHDKPLTWHLKDMTSNSRLLYKNCVTIPFDALLGEYCTAGSDTVYFYQDDVKKAVTKEDRPVGQRFILQPDNDPKMKRKELDDGFTLWKNQHSPQT